MCGAWGLLSVGLWAKNPDAFVEARLGDAYESSGLFYGGGINQLVMQLIMVLVIAAWVTVTTGLLFFVLKKTIGLRVSAEEEMQGLDILEHGLAGYAPDMAHT